MEQDKNTNLARMTFEMDGEKHSGTLLAFSDEKLIGYFEDWWKEVGEEQFEAAIMDL